MRIHLLALFVFALFALNLSGCGDGSSACSPAADPSCVCAALDGTACSPGELGCVCALAEADAASVDAATDTTNPGDMSTATDLTGVGDATVTAGDLTAPGDVTTAGDLTAPGDASGDATTAGDLTAPGDTSGDATTAGDLTAPGDTSGDATTAGDATSPGDATSGDADGNQDTGCVPEDEVCDDVDNDCDGIVDNGCDPDGDGWCDANLMVFGQPTVCPMGGGDCDEVSAAGASVNPGAVEICNDLDDNCADGIDEGCNPDGDPYCDAEATTIGMPAVCPSGGGDCDESSTSINPGATDGCGLDWNCDGAPLTPEQVLAPVSIRGRDPSTLRENVATNGTHFGAVWIEEDALNRRVMWGLVDTLGQFVAGPSALTPASVSARATSLVWDPATSTWAVAWIESDRARLGFVDATGALVGTPVDLAGEIDPSSEIRILETGGVFGVFFERENAASGDDALWGQTYDPTTGTADAEVMLVSDTSLSLSLRQFSWATRPNEFWLLREDYRSTEVIPRGYELAGLRTNGTVALAALWRPFDTSTSRAPSLLTIAGDLYLAFVETAGAPDTLELQRLSISNGTTIGPRFTLASDVSTTPAARRGVVQTGAGIAVIYRSASPPRTYQVAEFNTTTFAPIAGPHALWFDALSTTASRDVPFFVVGSRYFVADATPTGGFFLNGFETDGTPYLATNPVSLGTFSSPFHDPPRRVTYDSTADAFRLLQSSPSDPSRLETALIDGAGTIVQTPLDLGPAAPDGCRDYDRRADGTWICLGQTTDFATCTATGRLHVLDTGAGTWTSIDVLSVSGDPTDCGLFLEAIGERAGGATEWLVVDHDFATSSFEIRTIVVDAGGAVRFDTPVFDLVNFTPTIRAFEVVQTADATFLTLAYTDASGTQIEQAAVDANTGARVLPPTVLVGPLPGDAYVGVPSFEVDGILVQALGISDGTTEHLAILRAAADGTSASGTAIPGVALEPIAISGVPEALTVLGKQGHYALVDASDTVLASGDFGYAGYYGLDALAQGYAAAAASNRWLVANDRRLVVLPSVCGP